MELLLTLAIPAVLSLSGIYFLSFFSYFRKSSLLLLLPFSLLCSLILIIIPVSFFSLTTLSGFSFLAKTIFFISLLLSVVSVFSFKKFECFRYSSLNKLKKNIPRSSTFFIIMLFLKIFLLMFSFRPIAEGDIVETYLPFAGSIIINDGFPKNNYYDNRPLILPPMGYPSLLAYFYAVRGTLKSEVFRLINFPFFLAFLSVSYYLFRKYFSRTVSLSALLILLTFPMVEDMVFFSGMYPDFIFAFLCICVFYILHELIAENGKSSAVLFLFLGLSLNLSLLFKFQGILLYPLVFSVLLAQVMKRRARIASVLIIITPYF